MWRRCLQILLEEQRHVDEVVCCLQDTSTQASVVRYRALSLWMDMVGRLAFKANEPYS